MGYRTPNIDRIAAEGVRFTDYYGEQSCTAGRSAFITGQNPYRTGLSKVGMPGADIGLQAPDPTIATALKAQGYTTGQFGKNHLGDKDEFLPTMHGFDEFFGNLYHLNAEEEPEHEDYPTDEEFPNFRERFGPRGVIHSWANGDGTQRIEDTGPLTKERMKTIDEEILPEALRFMGDAKNDDTPFFLWFNTTHMHFRTHIKDGSRGKAGRWQSEYHDVMVDHDELVGQILAYLDENGLAEDTIVMYSTDNGPHMNTWPDAGMTPFRNEKNSNWEGAYRVPAMVRWPGHIPAGEVLNGIVSHNDWFVTFLAAAGDPDIQDELQGRRRPERHDLQGPPRRAQPARLHHRCGRRESATALLLRVRRRRPHGAAFRQLEGRVPRTARHRHAAGVGRALHRVARPEDLQPANRPLRTCRHHVEHVLRLAARPGVGARAGAGICGQHAHHARRVPASAGAGQLQPRERAREAAVRRLERVIELPAGTFRMGSDDHYPEEAPAHRVSVDAFAISPTTVTNEQFAAFVAATGYVTVAERPLDPADFPGAPAENLVAGSLVFTMTPGPVDLRHLSQWWTWTPGASWRHPEGPGSTIEDRLEHPVVHVAYEDAEAYAAWAGEELPTEAQWEYAARGGADDRAFVWGDEAVPGGQYLANFWQGDFPWRNSEADGFTGTAPVGSFPPNDFGLFDMAGNVWEWTTDWYSDAASGRCRQAVLRAEQPSRPRRRGELRPGPAAVPDPPQGDQGRVVPLRRQLLSALPPRRSTTTDDRHRHEPHRLPHHHPNRHPPKNERGAALSGRIRAHFGESVHPIGNVRGMCSRAGRSVHFSGK